MYWLISWGETLSRGGGESQGAPTSVWNETLLTLVLITWPPANKITRKWSADSTLNHLSVHYLLSTLFDFLYKEANKKWSMTFNDIQKRIRTCTSFTKAIRTVTKSGVSNWIFALNDSTCLMQFHNKQSPAINSKYTIGDSPVSVRDTHRDLGVIMQSWNDHYNHICSKANPLSLNQAQSSLSESYTCPLCVHNCLTAVSFGGLICWKI